MTRERRGRPNLRGKDACNRDKTEAGLKTDNTTNRAAREEQDINSYTDDPRLWDKAGTKKKTEPDYTRYTDSMVRHSQTEPEYT